MPSPWSILLAAFLGLKCCSALANDTNSSTTSTTSSILTSSRIKLESTSRSDQQAKTSSDESSSSSSDAGLGSFILHGIGVTLSASTVSSSSISTTPSSPQTSPGQIVANATDGSQPTTNQTSTESLGDAQSCNSASVSWLSAHANNSVTTSSTSLWTTTYSSSTRITPNGTVFTLCDNYPRMNVKPSVLVSTSTTVLTTVVVKTLAPSCTSNCPSCSIGSKDCSSLWSSWKSNTGTTQSTGASPACPSPTTSAYACPNFMPGPPDCFFTAGPVRLVYFPPEIKGNRLCGNYTTVPPPSNITAPVTVETFGTTFTSGTAYISFESLAAVDTCGNPTGTPMKDLFIPLPSSEVSSMCGANGGVFITGPTSTAVNFADLQTPIASDVYKCQPKCIWGGEMWSAQCPTIFDDFAPALAYPTQVKQLQPEWKECWFKADEYFRYQYGQEYYLFDPPIALTKTNSEAGVTLPNTPTPPPLGPAPAGGEVPSPTTSADTTPTTTRISSDSVATSPEVGAASPSNDQTISPSQHDPSGSKSAQDPSNTKSVDDPSNTKPVEVPTNPSPVDDPTSPGQSDEHAKTTAGESPSDALGVFSDALTTADGGNSNTAGPTPAEVAPSPQPEPNDPVTAAADPTQAQGLVVGTSLTIPVQQGQATSIDLPDTDPVAVSREGSAYVVAGQTLTPGQAATVQGQVISAVATHDAGVTPAATMAPASPLDISRSGPNYVLNGETITPGQIATLGGQTISLDSGANVLLLGSSTLSLQPGASTHVAQAEITAAVAISRSGSVYLIDGTALTPGQPTIVNGQTISEEPAGQHLFVGTKSITLGDGTVTTLTPDPANPNAVAISRSGSAFIVDGTTLSAGAASVVDGQTVSALSNGEGVLVGSQTVSLDNGDATSITPASSDPTELAVSRSGSSIIVDGTTLTPGEAITVDGQAVSVLSNGEGAVVGSRTIALSDGEATTAIVGASISISAEGLITIGSKTFTAYAVPGHSNQVLIDGKTLTNGGPALTTDGETLSLGSSGLVAVAHGQTSTVALTGSTAVATTSPASTAAGGVASQPASATTTSGGYRLDSYLVWRTSLMCFAVLGAPFVV